MPSEAHTQSRDDSCPEVVRAVATVLADQHLSGQDLDDRVCQKWGRRFISLLDPRKMYFLRSDIDEFSESYHQLDDLMRNDDLAFATRVHERFNQRIHTAVGVANLMLSSEHDFGADESVSLRFTNFANTMKELEERWRLRIKSEILFERANGSATREAVEFLHSRYAQIQHQYRHLDNEGVCQIYADALATSFDPHSTYLSKSELALFTTGLVPNYTIGLDLVRRRGEYFISGVSPQFSNYAASESLNGWCLIAIRRIDGTTHHLTEVLRPQLLRLLLSPTGPLKRDEEIIIELYNPVTHQRVSRTWPRLQVR